MNKPTPQARRFSVVLDYVPESQFLAIATSFDRIAENAGAMSVHKENSMDGSNFGRLTADFADEAQANQDRDQIQEILAMTAKIVITDAMHPALAE